MRYQAQVLLAFALLVGCSSQTDDGYRLPSSNPKAVEQAKVAASKASTSNNKVRDLCYVYWDGIRWKEGKTEGDDFRRYSRAKYGVELVEISIPQVMTDSLGLTRSGSGEVEDSQKMGEFLDKYWYQIETLCDFS